MKMIGMFFLFVMTLGLSLTASATVQKHELLNYVYEYDAAIDSKAIGTVNLRNVGLNSIPSGCVIEDVQVFVNTAFTSGGSATVVLGNSVDADGYLADIFTLLGVVNTPIRAGEVAGALLWDDTNDHAISYYIPSAAASIPKLTIGTAALTAGKATFIFAVRCY